MSNPFLGEIRMFAGNFAPYGWAFCNGQLLAIQSNTALFSILGTTYGGNGTTNFQLPNLQSRVPVGAGTGQGLSSYNLGQMSGSENVTLLMQQLPSHTHVFNADAGNATTTSPANANLATVAGIGGGRGAPPPSVNTYTTGSPSQQNQLSPTTIGPVGGNQPHSNLQPYLSLSFIIALQGIYPARN